MKIRKRILTAMLASLMLLGSFAGCGSPADGSTESQTGSESVKPEDIKATVDVWTWEPIENQQAVIEDFNKAYPNIEIVFTTINAGDMAMKIQTALASDTDVPDVVWSEISSRGKLMSFDCWEDLSKDPYNIDKNEMLDYQIPVSVTPSGKLAGIEVSTPVAGLAYKRDLAKEYLGTDDDKEIMNIIKSWDDMTEIGRDVLEKSGGKVKLFCSPEEPLNILKGQNTEPYVVDNKLNLKASLGDAFDTVIEMTKEGIVGDVVSGTPGEDAAIAGSEYIFFGCPTWAPTWKFKAKDPEGTGNWGLTLPPDGGYMNGGTVVCIPEKAEDKDAAFEYIKWCYFSKDGAVSNRDNLDYMTAYKPIYEDESFYTREDEFFNGQDVLKTFAQTIVPNTKTPRAVHKYDAEVNEAISIAIKTIMDSKGDVTTDQILQDMSKEILDKVPELEAE